MNKANINIRTGKKVLMTVIITLFLSMVPQFAAKADNEGSLTIHKLSSVGVEVSQKDPNKVYYTKGDGIWYEYIADVKYDVYQIGTFKQESENGVVSIKYEPIQELNLETIDKNTLPGEIDIANLVPVATVTTSSEAVKITDGLNKNGIYLIKESEKPTGVSVGNDFIITIPMYDETAKTWINDVEVFPKNVVNIPYIKKTITNDEAAETNVFYANVGDSISYTINVTAPADMDKNYQIFQIIDNSSANLLIETSTIKVSGISYSTGTRYDLIHLEDYTIIYENNTMTISLEPQGITRVGNKDTIKVTYDAKINGPVDTAGGGIVNNVALKLDDDDDPIKPDPEVDPDPTVYIYSHGVKKLGKDSIALAGAEFVLATDEDEDGVYTYLSFDKTNSTWTAVAKENATIFKTTTEEPVTGTQSEAILQFINLNPKIEYYLIEVSAPEDYQLLLDPIKIVADQDTTEAVYASYDSDGNYKSRDGNGYTTTIQNVLESDYPGSLPSTGGNGVYIFIIVGAALIIIALVLLVRSKKQ